MTYSSSLRLRAIEPDDIELLYTIENDMSLWQHGDTTVPYSRESLRQYLLECTNDIWTDRQVRLVMETTHNGEAVGLADLFNFDPKHQRAEIGLVVLPQHQGKGYSALALDELIRLARQWHLHQLTATIGVNNAYATKLFIKSDFKPSAHLLDWLLLPDGTYTDAIVWQLIL